MLDTATVPTGEPSVTVPTGEPFATAIVPTGEPFATAIVPTGEPSATVPTGEPHEEAMGSGELEEEEEGAGLRDMMIPAGVVVGVLAVGGVGAVVVALACCLCYRAKRRHSQEGELSVFNNHRGCCSCSKSDTEVVYLPLFPFLPPKGDFDISDNKAYSSTSATPLGHSKEEKGKTRCTKGILSSKLGQSKCDFCLVSADLAATVHNPHPLSLSITVSFPPSSSPPCSRQQKTTSKATTSVLHE